MTRLLSIVLLASFFAGFLAPGTQSSEAVAAQAVSTHNGGHSGMAMAADCSACPMPGACIAATAKEPFTAVPSRLQPVQPSQQHPDRVPAPDTAPPKRFSA